MVKTAARCLLFSLLFIALNASIAAAQVATADVVGRVTDATGATVFGARVTIENLETHSTRYTLTSASGDYAVNLLSPGPYALRIEMSGFKTHAVPDLALAAGDRARVDAQMRIGETEETIEVRETTPALQSDSSALGMAVTEQPVQDLPLDGRNYIELARLVAGANPGPDVASRPEDRRQSTSISVNGQSEFLNNSMIDGMDNNERNLGTIVVRPSIDAIAEFRVQTNLYTAEVGRTAGGVVSIITKSGTNEFHGSAYEFFRNDALDARSYFSTAGPKPEYRQNQFGGSIGGPLIKNNTFFFGDYEGLRIVQGITTVDTVPTQQQIGGDFSDLPTPIFNPDTGEPFPGNLIPPERIDPIGARYAALYPAPTRAGLVNNYSSSQNRTQFSHIFDARVDHMFSGSDSFFARYSFNDVSTFSPGILPRKNGIEPGGAIAGQFGPTKQVTQSTQLHYMHVFSPKLLVDLNAGYSRFNTASYPLNYGKNVSEEFGMPGVNVSPETSGLSPAGVYNYAWIGDSVGVPLKNIGNNFQYAGSVSYTRGRHSFKLGAGLIRRRDLFTQQLSGLGIFIFTGWLTGNPVSDLLLGTSTTLSRINELVAPEYRSWESSVYVQDDWHMRPRFTLNIGLRYDVFTPFTEKHDRISNLDVTAAKILAAGQNGVSKTAGIKRDYKNIAPRVGFALTLGHGLLIRGGYGLTFFPTNYSLTFSLKNPPTTSSYENILFRPLSEGLPVPTPIDPSNPSGIIFSEALDYRSGCLQQINLTVEKEFTGNVMRISYVGELGRHLAQVLPDINVAPPSPLPDPRSRSPFARTLPNVSTLRFAQSKGSSAYHALQASFERRNKAGLTLGANYTLAHNIDDIVNLSNFTSLGFGVVPGEVDTLDRGNADLDVRHRFVLMANYEFPFGKSLKGSKGILLRGWQINGIGVYQSGLPFSIMNNIPMSNTGANLTLGYSDRPDRIKGGRLAHPTLNEYFDTSAFVAQPFGTVGNSGRNILFGPSFKTISMSLFKQFDLKESWHLQFRAECYNISNTPSFGNPNGALGAPGFGTISSMNANYTPRLFQFALKLLF